MIKKITYSEVFEKISLVLKPERSFFITSIIYGIGVSLLMLAIPVSVQSLINTVTFGVIAQPLVVLSLVLFGLLLFSGALNAMQTYTIESFQQHFYTRITSEIIQKLINASPKALEKNNKADLANRYFDVMTIQKSVTTLLTGGVAIVMQTLSGLLLLALYHPYFLVFDILLLATLYLTWKLYAKSGFITATKESKAKYNVGSMLDEIVELGVFCKEVNRRKQVIQRANERIEEYINQRRKHFKFVFSQNILLLLIYAFMSALILGLGGYLVIKQQLSLGQLVAAELVVTVILASFSKANKYLEALYDLYAAVDKISAFYELPPEDNLFIPSEDIVPGNITFKNVEVNLGDRKYSFDKTFELGKKYLVHSTHYTYKAMFLELIQGITQPDKGSVFLGDQHFNELSLPFLRQHIHVVNKPCIVEGSIAENLSFGNPNVNISDVRDALNVNNLEVLEDYFKKGVNLEINSNGAPLWSNQVYRLELARTLLSPAKVIVLSRFFDQIGTQRRNSFLKEIMKSDKTVILISNHLYPSFEFDEYIDFKNGEMIVKDQGECLE